jgi:hypothetical protein
VTLHLKYSNQHRNGAAHLSSLFRASFGQSHRLLNQLQQEQSPEQAQIQKNIFIPFEKLDPKLRAQIYDKIDSIYPLVEIDWDNIVVGLNEKGKIVLKGKNQNDFEILGAPTCWSK